MSHFAKAQTLVRLAAEELSFAPAQLQAGAHPTAVSFQWHNFGPAGHHLINGAVRADFYLSRNNVAGDGDDVFIGSITDTITVNDGFDLNYALSAAQRNQLTIPIDASGAYYVVVCARHQAGSGYFDDNGADDCTRTAGTVMVQALVRLAAEELSFAPAQLQAGAHPTAVSFQWHNFGPAGHHLINGAVRADFYLSRNNVAGDGDDVFIGSITDTITVNDGSDLNYALSGAQRNQLTIPIDASGAYYVVVCARHQAGSGYFDDNGADDCTLDARVFVPLLVSPGVKIALECSTNLNSWMEIWAATNTESYKFFRIRLERVLSP